MKKEIFEITKEHLILLQRMYVSWEDQMYYGAPAIDIKRPYGNKTVYEDIAEMLGWKLTDTVEHGKVLEKKQTKLAEKLHMETQTALQICLCTQKFEIGKYEMSDIYDVRSWIKLS